jgi:hypothetical protein
MLFWSVNEMTELTRMPAPQFGDESSWVRGSELVQVVPVFSLIDASKEVGLEINIYKTGYILLSRHQNVGQIGT